MGNEHLNSQVKEKQTLFLQKVCEKHEYIEVKMTTAPINCPNKWLQCKHCGKVYDKNNHRTF